MNEQPLAPLIREIEPKTFSERAHGYGHRVVCSKDGNTSLYHRGRLEFFLGRNRNERQYYVRNLSVPLEINDWNFRWSEGTSAIALDFKASFQIQANTSDHALKLVATLAKAENPAEALRTLITKHLYFEMNLMLHRCQASDDGATHRSLLADFHTSSLGISESESLNKAVSKAVDNELRGAQKSGVDVQDLKEDVSEVVEKKREDALFRIGFQVLNLPPIQVSISQEDKFKLGDSKEERTVATTALLELDNFQNFRKAELKDETAVREAVSYTISQAVKRHLFAKSYYEVVQSFSTHDDSIETKMKEQISADAAKIGYQLNLFQAFPDIAALALIDGKRLDLLPEDYTYKPNNSYGIVRMNIAVNVTASAFKKLGRLIDPDQRDIDAPIRNQIARICRDEIQRINSTQFNLQFEEEVRPQITRAIIAGLNDYDLDAEVIYVTQHPTEDAERFAAIRGQHRSFEIIVPSQADAGDADEVQITGRFEIVGMGEGGWEQFVRKDFGYRSDTHLSLQQIDKLASESGIDVPVESPMSDEHRRSLAIEIELAAIRQEVMSGIRGLLATEIELAGQMRTKKGRNQIIKAIHTIAERVVEQAFGFKIQLYGVDRGNTLTELVLQRRRAENLGAVIDRSVRQRESDLKKFETITEGQRKAIEEDFRTLYTIQQERTDNIDADLAQIKQRLQDAIVPSDASLEVSYDEGMKILMAAKKQRFGGHDQSLTSDEREGEELSPPTSPE